MNIARDIFILLAAFGAVVALTVYTREQSRPITVVRREPLPPRFVPVETPDGRRFYRLVQPTAEGEIVEQYRLAPEATLRLNIIQWTTWFIFAYLTVEYLVASVPMLRGGRRDQKAAERVHKLVMALLAGVVGYLAAPTSIERVPIHQNHEMPSHTFVPVPERESTPSVGGDDVPTDATFAPTEVTIPKKPQAPARLEEDK